MVHSFAFPFLLQHPLHTRRTGPAAAFFLSPGGACQRDHPSRAPWCSRHSPKGSSSWDGKPMESVQAHLGSNPDVPPYSLCGDWGRPGLLGPLSHLAMGDSTCLVEARTVSSSVGLPPLHGCSACRAHSDFFLLFLANPSHMEFQGQGSDLSCSCGIGRS